MRTAFVDTSILVYFRDAMIVHAARVANASVLYSEDMQHGVILGGVRIENPFLGIGAS